MMFSYYNEFDPFAAQWLRELIKCGFIADGVVDERSITVEGVTAWAKMSGIDVSNPYPKTKPKKPGDYFVKLENGYFNSYPNNNVSIDYFNGTEFSTYDDVIAWAEKPEPYRPPETEDNHPDAVTARKYMSGDPETIKALSIFDE